MEGDHEKLEETMRSEHEVSVASYVAEAELLTEVTLLCQSVASRVDIGGFPNFSLIEVFMFLNTNQVVHGLCETLANLLSGTLSPSQGH